HGAILEPEIEQVAVDEEGLAQVGNGLQEAVERGLDRGRDLSQMGVGDDEHAGGHGPKLGAAPERRKQRCCILPGVISTITLRVNYSETDQMGVVYYANYLIWFDRARTELMRETGVTYKELEQQGVYLAVSEVKVRYRAAARYDDLVRVRCWVSSPAGWPPATPARSTRRGSARRSTTPTPWCGARRPWRSAGSATPRERISWWRRSGTRSRPCAPRRRSGSGWSRMRGRSS